MDRPDKYHPSLFSREQDASVRFESELVIPQSTLYDAPVQTQHTPPKKHVVLFGYTPSNKKNVLDQVSKLVGTFKKEEGKNYIKIWSEDASSLDAVLKLNHKMINGEIIGVYRQNFGAVEDSDIYAKKKGILRIVFEYLFGE